MLSNETTTENGMKTHITTENGLTDFFFACGALRNSEEQRIKSLFKAALEEDPVNATRILFYSRDVRGGQGERKLRFECAAYACVFSYPTERAMH